MKKFLKISLILLSVIFIAAVSGYIYLQSEFPKIDKAPDIKIEPTAERLSRGKYLFNSVFACVDCHSQRDVNKFSGPVIPGTEGMGGQKLDEEFGLPGTFYTKNITPAGVGDWTDGELLRAITEGVSKDGEPLFPLMPYLTYGKADKEDIYSVIAYMRTLPPVVNEVPKSKPNFPLNFIQRTIPEKNNFSSKPNPLDKIASGKYLVDNGGCTDCHTQSEKGEPKPNMFLAGGTQLPLPANMIVTSANLTPDMETGLGKWTKEDFIKKFRAMNELAHENKTINPGEFNTYMPWSVYAGMTDEDLGNMYEFLRTIPPVNNRVEKFGEKSKY
ncbi:MAG: cytochrome C [Ignavibacteriae bacterium]|nr:MAG: cytochrome C [Ignavibacteriota bacterium]